MFRFSRPCARCFALILSALVMLLRPGPSPAADGVWDVNQTGLLNWVDGNNWVNSVVPGLPGGATTDKATFGAVSTATTVTIDAGRTIHSLDFTSGSGAYTIGGAGVNQGNPLNLVAGGSIRLLSGSLTTVAFDAPLILQAGTYTFSNNTSTTVANATEAAAVAKLNFQGGISGGTATAPITLNLNGTVGTRNASSAAAAALQANQISGAISDGGTGGVLSLQLNGGGPNANNMNAWNLTGANSYSGSTTVSGNSTLYFNSIGNVGEASAIGTGVNGNLIIGGFVIYTGAAASSNRTLTGAGGSLYNVGTGTLTLNGGVAINGNSAIIFRGTNTIDVEGVISGVGSSVLKTNSNTLIMGNSSNSFTGNLNVSAGMVSTSSIANAGVISGIGAGTTIYFGQNQTSENVGTLRLTGALGGSTNRAVIINSGSSNTAGARGTAVFENAVAGQTMTMNGTVRANGSAAGNAVHNSALVLAGTGDGAVNGVIGGLSGAGLETTAINLLLTKNGTGLWALSAANLYYGGTNITAGTLLATNTSGSATGTGNVTTTATGTLGGTGYVTGSEGGSLTINSGTSLMVGNTHGVAAGAAGAGGYLAGASQFRLGSAADVAITLAGNLRFDLFGNDVAAVTDAEADRLFLATTAAGITLGGTVVVDDVSGASDWRSQGGPGWTSGTWQLVDWTGAASATQSGVFTYNLDSAPLAIGYRWETGSFLTDGTLSVVRIADADIHIWTGAESGSWNNVMNWTAGSVPVSASDVIFDTYTANTTSAIDGDKTVRNVLFTGATDNTVNTGTGGVLYLGGDAANGATIQVQGGVQTFGAGVRVGVNSSAIYIINDGTLRFNGDFMANQWGGTPTDKVVTFSGTGDTTLSSLSRRHSTYDMILIKNGTGTVTINGETAADATPAAGGAITGSTTINEGKIRIRSERALGAAPDEFEAAHLTLDGGVLGAFGTFTMDDENRGVTLGPNGGGVDVEGSFVLTMANPVTGEGSLEKTGSGALVLTGANTYTGDTQVSAGTLLANNESGSATGSGSVITSGSAVLGGHGAIAAGEGKSITVASGTTLRVGETHGVAGLAQDLHLGMVGDVAVSIQGTLQIDIFGAGSTLLPGDDSYDALGDANDLLEITTEGALNLDGMVVQISALDLTDWAEGQTWKLIDWSNIAPGSVSHENVTLETENFGDLMLVQTFTADGYYVTAMIPEPSRAVLLVMAGCGLLLRRKRRAGNRGPGWVA